MKIHNLIKEFNREIEILDVNDQGMYYVLDRKSENGNMCEILFYDFGTKISQYIMTCRGTRLYESFRTYKMNKDYFFIEVVEDDYKVKLEKISKKGWKREGMNEIVPEGEILGIFPLNDEYILVSEEIQATDEALYQYNDEDFEGRYYTLVYLYGLYDQKKYYLQQFMDQHQIVDFCVQCNQVFLNLQAGRYSRSPMNAIAVISMDDLKAYADGERKPELSVVYESPHEIRTLKNEGYPYVFMDRNSNILKIMGLDSNLEIHTVIKLRIPEEGEIFVDDAQGKIYHIDRNEHQVVIEDFKDKKVIFTYDEEYGDFNGMIADHTAVTSFYKTEMLREDMVYKEYVALHAINHEETEVTVLEGNAQMAGDHIILLKSFLFL